MFIDISNLGIKLPRIWHTRRMLQNLKVNSKKNLLKLFTCYQWIVSLHVLLLSIYLAYLQLKEMVLALLSESELNLSDDVVEIIVDKVKNDLYVVCMITSILSFLVLLLIYLLSLSRHLWKQMQKAREELMKKSGKSMWQRTPWCWRTWLFHIWCTSNVNNITFN